MLGPSLGHSSTLFLSDFSQRSFNIFSRNTLAWWAWKIWVTWKTNCIIQSKFIFCLMQLDHYNLKMYFCFLWTQTAWREPSQKLQVRQSCSVTSVWAPCWYFFRTLLFFIILLQCSSYTFSSCSTNNWETLIISWETFEQPKVIHEQDSVSTWCWVHKTDHLRSIVKNTQRKL